MKDWCQPIRLAPIFFQIWVYFPFNSQYNKIQAKINMDNNMGKGRKMKNWKRWLAAGCMAALLGIGTMGTTVMAMGGGGVDRSEAVAEEEKVPGARATSSTASSKAWKKLNGVCYNGSGQKLEGAITRGIDVSEWQDTIDWSKVKKSNVDFAFVRISYGLNHIDMKYDYNMKQAEKVGMPVGTYIYSLATTTQQAMKEAQLAIKKMNGYKVSYPVVYDIEYEKMRSLSSTQIANLAKAFCNEVKKAGYYPMIYCNTDWYDNKLDWSKMTGYDVWLARYGDTILAPNKKNYKYTIWQATDGDGGGYLKSTKGLVSGIPSYSTVDIDFGYVDYTKIITPRWRAVTSYKASTKPDTSNGKTGWVTENGKKFYYVNGVKKTGWIKVGGKKYYIDKTLGMYKSKLLRDSKNVVRYVDRNGVLVKNRWITVSGKKYYFDQYGHALKGRKKVGQNYYYFQTKYGYMMKHVRYMDSKDDLYYFGGDGIMVKSVFYTWSGNNESHTYYFTASGRACRSWLTHDGKKYYFDPETAIMYKNCTIKINGKSYTFDANGVYITAAAANKRK